MISYKEFVQSQKYINLRHNPELLTAGLLRPELDQLLVEGQRVFYRGDGSEDPRVTIDPELIRPIMIGDTLPTDFWFPNREEYLSENGLCKSFADVGVCVAYTDRYNGHRLFSSLEAATQYHELVGSLPILHRDLTQIRGEYVRRGRFRSSW